MGRKGIRPRKPRRSQHLPKVGTATEDKRALHEEREAVLDNVGMAGAGSWVKGVVVGVAALLFASAVVALIAFN